MVTPVTYSHGEVVDIGGKNMYGDVGERLLLSLRSWYGHHENVVLPDELLYDDIGLPIWNKICFIPEFYQTHDEIALLSTNGPEIVSRMPDGITMIDLGAGDTRKVDNLLQAFEAAKKPATYLALDISKYSLDHNVAFLEHQHSRPNSVVTCAGLWGTFQDGKQHVQSIEGPRLFLSLGSVLCNDAWPKALDHLKFWSSTMRSNDFLLLGMDGHLVPKDTDKLWAAYHSCDDLYREFFVNGFNHANELIGESVFREDDWDFLAELEEQPTTRHRFFFRARRDIHITKVDRTFKQGEEIEWFDSHKYGEQDVRLMCYKANLSVIQVWQAPDSEFRQYLLRKKEDGDQKEDADSAVSGVN